MEQDDIQQELETIFEYYKSQNDPGKQENLVEFLREVQALLGCVPLDVQDMAVQEFKVKPVLIQYLIKLYPSLTSAPCRHKITLCLGPECSKRSAQQLLNALKQKIRGKPFFLVTKNCMKKCTKGPNLMIDGDFYAGVGVDDLDAVLKKYES